MRQPKNRFLPRTHISEAVLVRVLFCWLNGALYSEIPSKVVGDDDEVESAIGKFEQLMGAEFELVENDRRTISRQSCHNVISEVSLHVIVGAYRDRIRRMKELLESRDQLALVERRRVVEFLGHDPTPQERDEIIDDLQRQEISSYIRKWGTLVYVLSADAVPYEAIRSRQNIKPFDIIQDPFLLDAMRLRFRRFKGYKASALKAHIAQYFALRQGTDYVRRYESVATEREFFEATEMGKSQIWSEIVVRALMLLMLQLQTGLSYIELRTEIWDQKRQST